MTSDTLKLFLTPEHDCSYLPDKTARSMFVNPSTKITSDLYSSLNLRGFRRSGKYLYKPHCEACNACMASRVLVNEFKPNRSQKRIMRRNEDLKVTLLPSISNTKCYELYEKYITLRHADGDKYPPSIDQYQSFLVEQLSTTIYIGFFLEDELVCVSVIDQVDDGLSALYTFYNPDLTKRALGVNAILWQLSECKKLSMPFLYLGYWIENCQKMNYKSAYQPQEIYKNEIWQKISP